jgi:maltooligosyltrehalose trehalohydrolase
MAVNFGEAPATLPVDSGSGLLFTTGDGVDLEDGLLSLPAHGGALAAPL